MIFSENEENQVKPKIACIPIYDLIFFSTKIFSDEQQVGSAVDFHILGSTTRAVDFWIAK